MVDYIKLKVDNNSKYASILYNGDVVVINYNFGFDKNDLFITCKIEGTRGKFKDVPNKDFIIDVNMCESQLKIDSPRQRGHTEERLRLFENAIYVMKDIKPRYDYDSFYDIDCSLAFNEQHRWDDPSITSNLLKTLKEITDKK